MPSRLDATGVRRIPKMEKTIIVTTPSIIRVIAASLISVALVSCGEKEGNADKSMGYLSRKEDAVHALYLNSKSSIDFLMALLKTSGSSMSHEVKVSVYQALALELQDLVESGRSLGRREEVCQTGWLVSRTVEGELSKDVLMNTSIVVELDAVKSFCSLEK